MPMLCANVLKKMGFKSLGNNVQISDKASFYGIENIKIGNNVRIDDFCVLSAGTGGIEIGNFVHIAVFSSLIGKGRISLGDFCNLSSRVSIYSSSDDYSGSTLSNPTIPENFKNVKNAPVSIRKHVIIGSGSIILPGVEIKEGAAIGALSLVNRDCEAFTVNAGIPAVKIKDRIKELLNIEKKFLLSIGSR